MDIKKFLETVDRFDFAGEKQGQKPGQQWKGTDKGLPGTKLVGELDKHVKETHVERKLRKDFKDFKEFDSDDWAEWDAKIKRLKQRAKQGELVTVWDKEKRVYKNVPKSEIKEYQNRMDPDAQVTSPPSPDASQTAIDQVQDKIFARDVEGETVEEEDEAVPTPQSKTSWQDIHSLNPNLKDPNKIYPGQQLKLPDGSSYTVQKGDSLSKIAASNTYKSQPIAPSDQMAFDKKIQSLQTTKVEPVSYTPEKEPISVRQNNPGNLRYAGQAGAVKDPSGYARFSSAEAGMAAMRRQLNLDMQRRGMNLTQALYKYAPPSDNNPTDRYIEFVANKTGIDPTKPIPKEKMADIQRAMIEFEGGRRAVRSFYPPTTESLMADYQKFIAEYGNQQAPDQQATSGDTPESDAEAELKRQRMDRRVSQGTMGGLSAVLPPGTNTTLAASALTKIVDQKPLTPQENQAISGLMPLLARAAEEPSTSASLKTALGKAGMLTKLGKQ